LKIRVFLAAQAEFCHPGAAKTAKKHASLKIWRTARKRQKNHQNLKKWSKMKKNIFEKFRNFSALDERDCQAAWLFAHWGQFGRETRAWPDGADPPHFHMHMGKIGQFFRIRVFPATQAGLCVDGPCKAAWHLQNTPGTPAMHFPLVVAGSQSAL
jgi:hypothetical protein